VNSNGAFSEELLMFVIWGRQTYGKVDKVPKLFYVCTQFFHLYYVPLVPLRSYLVLAGSETEQGFKGVQTSLSLKSIVMAWLRAGLGITVLVSLLLGLKAVGEYVEGKPGATLDTMALPWLVGVVSIVDYWLTVRYTFAGRNRALVLAAELGVTPILVEKCLHGYRPTDEVPDEGASREQDVG
jgi:hypothetical protein